MSVEPLKSPRSKFLMLALALAHGRGTAGEDLYFRFRSRFNELGAADLQSLPPDVVKVSLLIDRCGQSEARAAALRSALHEFAAQELAKQEWAEKNGCGPVQLDWWRRGQYG